MHGGHEGAHHPDCLADERPASPERTRSLSRLAKMGLGLAAFVFGCQDEAASMADASAPASLMDATALSDGGGCTGGGSCPAACVPGSCPPERHCDLASGSCVAGCSADLGCQLVADAGTGRCDVAAHACVQCLDDADCPAGSLCSASKCAPGCAADHPCPLGSLCCAGVCRDSQSDDTCGACDVSCRNESDGGAVHCSRGACVVSGCAAGRADCDGIAADGCEVFLGSDPAHCGSCESSCDAGAGVSACVAGACKVTSCDAPFAACDGARACSTNTATSVLHCGGCDRPCTGANACLSGTCAPSTCPGSTRDCDADPAHTCETDTSSDLSNCGGCGHACSFANAAALCAGGTCTLGACLPGYAHCSGPATSGCEADLASDPANCGACGHACSPAICGAGISETMSDPPPSDSWYSVGSSPTSTFYDATTASFVLTPSTGAAGALVYVRSLVLDSMLLTFDLRMGGGLGGADGMGVVFETDSGKPGPGQLAGGGGLGMAGFHGYGVEFDTFDNGALCDDDSRNEIAIDSLPGRSCADGAGILPVQLVGNPTLPFSLRNTGWHTASISLEGGIVRVAMDGFPAIDGFALPNWTAGTPYYVAFVASAGTYGDRHEVRNVRMTFPTPRCL